MFLDYVGFGGRMVKRANESWSGAPLGPAFYEDLVEAELLNHGDTVAMPDGLDQEQVCSPF